MVINRTVNGKKLVIAVEGRLDTVTAPELEAEFSQSLGDAEELTLDLGKLDYMSSAGLRLLLLAQKTMMKKGGMEVVNVNSTIMEIFEITGFSDILTIK